MENNRLRFLLDKYLSEDIQSPEREELFNFLKSPDHQEQLEKTIDDQLLQRSFEVDVDEDTKAELLRHFEPVLHPNKLPAVQRVFPMKKWSWAAAVVLVAASAIGIAVWPDRKGANPDSGRPSVAATANIQPGSNKAVLTLSDGTTVLLDSMANGAIAQQGNVSVMKLPNGEIRYDASGSPHQEILENTMTTPQGGHYQLVLPDGTKVWLNAASSITYPVAFVGTQRQVKVTGEVYLEVAKNEKMPFSVDVDGKTQVRVLGTSFNINAYPDDGRIRTTLIEGRVKLSRPADSPATGVTLQPGQQAVLKAAAATEHDPAAAFTVNRVDVEQVLAWKNGIFSLTGRSFGSIMNEVERWYDIQVQYGNDMADFTITGEMDRGVQLDDLLRFLRQYDLNVQLNGRILTISRK